VKVERNSGLDDKKVYCGKRELNMISTTTTMTKPKQIVAKDSTVVYFAHCSGKLMMAPDTRVSPSQCGLGPEWRRCEAVGAREIEKVSLILSRQLWEEKKKRDIQQFFREQECLKQAKVRCKLRIAQSFSPNDKSINRQMLAKLENHESKLISLAVSEFDPTKRTSAMEMEVKPQSTAPTGANIDRKHGGIA